MQEKAPVSITLVVTFEACKEKKMCFKFTDLAKT